MIRLRTLLLTLAFVVFVETAVMLILVASGAPWYSLLPFVPVTASAAFTVGIATGARIVGLRAEHLDPRSVALRGGAVRGVELGEPSEKPERQDEGQEESPHGPEHSP